MLINFGDLYLILTCTQTFKQIKTEKSNYAKEKIIPKLNHHEPIPIYKTDHHSQQNWHEKHMEIHKKFPEQFSLELSSEEPCQAQIIYHCYY